MFIWVVFTTNHIKQSLTPDGGKNLSSKERENT